VSDSSSVCFQTRGHQSIVPESAQEDISAVGADLPQAALNPHKTGGSQKSAGAAGGRAQMRPGGPERAATARAGETSSARIPASGR